MNIWYINHYAGGPGIAKLHRAYHLSRAWAALGHSTTTFVARFHHMLDRPEFLPDMFEIDGVSYRAVNARKYSGNGIGRLLNMADYCVNVAQLGSLVPEVLQPPDAIIVSSPHPYVMLSASQLAKRYNAQLTFEVRDLWPLSMIEIAKTPKWHPIVLLTDLIERFSYRQADLVASLLAGSEDYMLTRGLKPNKFVHVPNGVSEDAFLYAEPVSPEGQRAAAQIAQWKQQNRLILIHPGAQGIPNALDLLIDAVSILNKAGLADRFGVLLIGDGGMTKTLKEQAKHLGMTNVVFVDPVPSREANWLTARCDIGYAGARDERDVYKYGTSFNKTATFMQAGIPIVLPIHAPLDPVAMSGAGIVTGSDKPTKIADAIRTLLEMSSQERQDIGAKGKSYVLENLNYSFIAARYAAAIERTRPRRI